MALGGTVLDCEASVPTREAAVGRSHSPDFLLSSVDTTMSVAVRRLSLLNR